MRIEILLFIIVSVVVANIYTEGKMIKKLMTYKKYYQMAGIIVGAFVLYWIIKRNPSGAREMVYSTNEYIKYLPVDRRISANFIEPLINFTKDSSFQDDGYNQSILSFGNGQIKGGGNRSKPLDSPSEKIKYKRSVSESKKKFIASKQSWRCATCNEILQATYEIDHKIRLEYGGSNEMDNLQALCRNCHGMKTMTEAL